MQISDDKQNQVELASNTKPTQVNDASQRIAAATEMASELKQLASEAPSVSDQNPNTLNQALESATEFGNDPERRLKNFDRDRTAAEFGADSLRALARGGVGLAEMVQGGLTRSAATEVTQGDVRHSPTPNISGYSGLDNRNIYQKQADAQTPEAKAKLAVENFERQRERSVALKDIREGLNEDRSQPLQLREAVAQDKIEARKESRKAEIQAKKDAGEWTVADAALEVGKEFVDATIEYGSSPSLAIDMGIESAVDLAVTGGVGKLGSVLAKTPAQATKFAAQFGVTSTVAQEGLSNANEIQLEVMDEEKHTHDSLMESSPSYADMIEKGVDPYEARIHLANQAYDLTFLVSGVGAGLISKVTGAGDFAGNLFNPKSELGEGIAKLFTSKAVTGTATEYVEEAGQSGLGQLAQNIASQQTVDEGQELTEGVGTQAALGSLAGAVSGGTMGTVQDAVNALAEAGDKYVQTAEKRATQSAAKADAVESGNLEAVTDVQSDNFDLKVALTSIQERNNREDVTPEEVAANFQEANRVWGEYVHTHVHTKQAAIDAAKAQGDVPTRDIRQAEKELENNKKIGREMKSVMTSMREQFLATEEDVNQAVEGDTDAVQRTMGSIRMEPDSITDDQAQALLDSGQLSDTETQLVQGVKSYNIATKALEEVSTDVFEGGDGFLGLEQYRDIISSAVESGNTPVVNQYSSWLSNFAAQRVNKADVATQALNETDPQERDLLLESIGLRKGGISQNLVRNLVAEAAAASAMNDMMQAIQVEPVTTQETQDVQEDTQVDTATDTTDVPVDGQTDRQVDEPVREQSESTTEPSGDTDSTTVPTDDSDNVSTSDTSDTTTDTVSDDTSSTDTEQSVEEAPKQTLAERLTTSTREESTEPSARLTPEQAEEQFKSINLVQEKFEPVVREGVTQNPLQVEPEFMTELAVDPTIALEHVSREELTEKQITLMQGIADFHLNEVVPMIDKIFKPRTEFKMADYMQYLADENGELDDNIKAAVTIAIVNWAATKGADTKFNDFEAINGITSRDKDAFVPKPLSDLLTHVGTVEHNVIENLGKSMVQAIGIKASREAGENAQYAMENSLGTFALTVMEQMGIVENTEVVAQDIEDIISQADERTTDVRPGKVHFVAIKDLDFLESTQEEFNGTENILEEVFSVESYKTGPTLEEPTEVVRKQKGTHMSVPKRVRNILKKHQKRKHYVKSDTNMVYNLFDDEMKKRLMGFVPDLSTVQQHNRAGVEGKNNQIENSIMHWNNFTQELGDESNPFYFNWEQWKNNRLGIVSNTVNPQGDKLHRHLLYVGDQNQVLDKNNPEHMEYLYVALAQGMDISIDKQSNENSIAEFKEMMDTKEMKLAIGSIQDAMFGTGQFDQEAVMAAVEAGGMQAHSLEALVTYASFLGSTGDTFTTSYSIEADGVTNGPAIATIQFAVGMNWDDVKARLKRVSIGLDGDVENYGDWKANPLNDDNYQAIGRGVQSRLEESDTSPAMQSVFNLLVGSLTKEIEGGIAVDKAGRNIPKGPLMTSIYGSGERAIKQTMGHMVVQGFYDYIEKHHTDRNKMIELGVTMNQAFGKGTVSKDLVNNPLEYVLPNEGKLENAGKDNYGDAIWDTINENYSEFMEQRTLVNSAMKIVFELFQAQYEHMVQVRTDEMTEAGLLNPKRETLPAYVREEIMAELLDAQPIMNNYFSTLSENLNEGLYVGKMEKVNPDDKEISKYRTEQEYNGVKKRTTNSRIRKFADGGVSPTVLAVQSIDAATMIQTLNEAGVLNVHDAIFTGLADGKTDVRNINANFQEVMNDYSIIVAANDALKRALVQADSFDKEFGTDLFSGKGTLGGHLAVMAGITTEKSRKTTPWDDWGDTRGQIELFVSQLNKTAHITANRKKEILGNVSYMAQYYLEGAGLERKTPDTVASWFERQPKEIPRQEAYTRLNGSYRTSKARMTKAVDNLIEQAKSFPSEPKYVALISALELYKGAYTKSTVRKALEGFNEQQQDFIVDRLNAHKEGYALNQNAVSLEKYNPTWEQRDLGSTERKIHEDDFNALRTEEVTSDTTETLFEELGNVGRKRENQAHQDTLRDHLKTVVSQVIEPSKVHLADTMENSYGSITGDDIYIYTQMTGETLKSSEAVTNSGVIMSAQEVLVHELTHSVLREGIEGNSVAKKELKRIFDFVKRTNAVTVRDLMDDPTLPETSDDYKRAQATHDYIFTIRTDSVVNGKKYSNYLHEFATFALTNEKVMAALESAVVPPAFSQDKLIPRSVADFRANWVQYIRNIFDAVIQAFQGKFTGLKAGQPLTGAMRTLALQLANVESGNKHNLVQWADKGGHVAQNVLNQMHQKIVKAARKAGNSSLLKNSKFRLVRAVGNVLRTDYEAAEKFMERVNLVKRVKEDGTQSVVGAMVTEMLGRTAGTARFHDLSRKKNYLLDHARKEIEANTYKALNDSFTMDLSDNQKVSITKAGIKTDLTLLMDYFEVSDIDAMLRSPTKLKEAVKDLRDQLLTDPNGIFYVNSAQALGVFMATGNVYEAHTLLNAKNISELTGLGEPMPRNAKKVEPLIDQLASLEALVHTNQAYKNTLSEIIRTDKDGFQYTMDLHRKMKADDKKNLFSGDEQRIIKGYTRDLTDPNVAIIMGTEAQTSEYRKQGYVRSVNAQAKDKHDATKDKVYLYTNPYGGHVAYAAGAISLTSQKAKGTDTTQIRQNVGSNNAAFSAALDNQAIRKSKIAEARVMRNTLTTSTKATGNMMVPILDSEGNVAAYRYMMNENTKDTLLKKHNNFDAVMGAMASNSLDKQNTTEVNQGVIDALREQYLEDIQFIPEAYLEISAKSEDPKLREIWATLPKETKAAARKAFRGDKILVRRDLVPIVFGFRKMSMSNVFSMGEEQRNFVQQQFVNAAEMLLGETAANRIRKAEDMWSEYVAATKEFIVVKSGIVTLANAISNSMQLSFEGVSWGNVAKYQAEAYREARQYRKDSVELWELETKASLGYVVDNQRIAELNHAIATNPVSGLIQDGMLQTIVEDVETVEDKFSHQSQLSNKLDGWIKNAPNPVQKGIENVRDELGFIYLSHDQKTFKLLNEAAQLSDFVSRYALYKHKVDNDSMSHDDAAGYAMDVFINYDMPTNPLVQYLNDMGLLWFTKYYFRIQKIIIRNFVERPARMLMHLIISSMTPWSTPTIVDSLASPDTLGNRMRLPDNPVDMISNSLPLQIL